MLYALIITNFKTFHSKYNGDETGFIGIVTKYVIDGDKLSINIKSRENLIATYYMKSEDELNFYKERLKLGCKVRVVGNLEYPPKNTVFNGFNYREYLYNNKIFFLIDADNIDIVSNNTSILYYLKNIIIKRINKIDKTGYLKTFIVCDKDDLDNQMLSEYRDNGVTHLFSVSGMHISLLAGIILFVLKKISYNNKINYLIVSLFLLFYLFLTNYSPSVLRTVVMFILYGLNKCYNLKIKNIDIVLFTLVIIILINPFYLYNIGFQYSYLISFILVLLSKRINNINGKLKSCLYISYVCFLVSFVISIYYFSQVNFLSIFINILLIPFVSIIIYPLALITFIFPNVSFVFNFLILILEFINNVFANINVFKVVLLKPCLLLIIIYYLIIFLVLYNRKFIILLFLVFLLHKSYIYIDGSKLISMVDVGQGDSIFVKFPNNNGNVLIDTGGSIKYSKDKWQLRKKEYSIVKDRTIPYLKSMGISKLDYLILSHGDYDHMGEAINLVNNFKVEKVIFNCGEFNDLEQELIKVLDKKHIKYYSCIKELNIDKNKLYFLQTKEYDNENDNSNVIYTELNGYKFMFMGDASKITENEILDKYNLPDIDVLKVGHHGSKTSSSKEFIDEIEPKYSVISVGKNNRYGHPNKEVLENLKESKIYRTDIDGSIEIKINNGKYKIRTCSP